jgi:perosamine synthetase
VSTRKAHNATMRARPLFDTSSRYDLKIVEAAAAAHSAQYLSRSEYQRIRCANLSDAACFSSYANKIISTGEGGIVLRKETYLVFHVSITD